VAWLWERLTPTSFPGSGLTRSALPPPNRQILGQGRFDVTHRYFVCFGRLRSCGNSGRSSQWPPRRVQTTRNHCAVLFPINSQCPRGRAFVRRGAGKELQIRLSVIVWGCARFPETDSRPEAHPRCFLCTRPLTNVWRSRNATHTIGLWSSVMHVLPIIPHPTASTGDDETDRLT
jgi:hypothetical protein